VLNASQCEFVVHVENKIYFEVLKEPVLKLQQQTDIKSVCFECMQIVCVSLESSVIS
jgi:hypothetical protein